MMIKIATFFLVAMAVLAMFGRLRFPASWRRGASRLPRPRRCSTCGSFSVTGGPCQRCDQGD